MTTPYAPSYIPFVDGITPIQAWAGIGQVGTPITMFNQDLVNPVYFGPTNTITIGGTNAGVIPPLATTTVDGARTIYVLAAAGTAPLEVVPGMSNTSASPAAVAEAIIEAGLATLIAEAIAGTGLPLIGLPTLLFNISSVPPSTGAGLVGFTIPNQAFQQAGCYDFGKTQLAADNQMAGILGRSLNGHPSFTKKFWSTVSRFNLPFNDMQNYGANGTRVACCLQPVFYPGLPANSDFRTAPQLTPAQQAQAVTDYAGITTFFNTLLGAPYNFTASQLIGVLWQEPEIGSKGMSATDYQNMLHTYGASIPAGITLTANIGSGAGAVVAQAYANAAIASGAPIGAMAQDYYMPTFRRGQMLTDGVVVVADAHNLPFGVYEMGAAPHNFTTGVTDTINYFNHITTVMSGRLQAGKVNADVEYYMGQCTANGAGDLSSPIGLDPTQPAPDFRIALYQTMFDTLTSVPTTPFTIAANSTVTITAANPSPVGKFAPADYLSYEIALGLVAGVGSTNPFVSVNLLWYDFDEIARNQTPVAKENWHLPMGANADPNGPLVVYGGGRMHGGFLQLKINNQDSVACTVSFLQLAGTSRIGARSSWFWNPNTNVSPAVPGFTNADAADQSMQIGREYGKVIAAGASATYLNGLFCGEAVFRCKVVNAAASDVTFELQPVPAGVFNAGTDIFHQILGAAGNFEVQPMKLALPRAPTVMFITNNDVNPVTIEYLLTAIETG